MGLFALVFVAHVLLLGGLLRPAAPKVWHGYQSDSISEALQVRFDLPIAQHRPAAVGLSTQHLKHVRPHAKKRRIAHSQVRPTYPAAPVGVGATAMHLEPSLRLAAPDVWAEPKSDTSYARQNVRVPEQAFVSRAPELHMVDPRHQGFSGFLRGTIGNLLDHEDTKCLDLDAWRGMTQVERIAHHLPSDVEMEKIADTHDCGIPRPGLGRPP